jgi:hypothetical protein
VRDVKWSVGRGNDALFVQLVVVEWSGEVECVK